MSLLEMEELEGLQAPDTSDFVIGAIAGAETVALGIMIGALVGFLT
jgi:hypothetical protein